MTIHAPAPPITRSWRFTGSAFALGVLALGSNESTALYQVYGHRFGFGPLTSTLVFAIYCAALLPALIVSGRILDLRGSRFLGAGGLGLAAAGCIAFAAADGTAWLYVARAIQGVGVGIATGPLTAGLVVTEPSGDGSRASRVGALVLCGGAGLGPVVAGASATWLPAPLALCYLVEVALIVAAIPLTFAGSSHPAARPRRARAATAVRAEAAGGGLVVASLMSALAWAVTAVFLSLVPSFTARVLATDNLAVTGTAAGLLLLAAAAVQPAARRLFPAQAMRTGLGLLALGAVLLLVASAGESLALLLVAVAVAGAGQGQVFAASLNQAAGAAHWRGPGQTWAVFYMITYVGEGGPVIVIGLMANHLGLVDAVRVFLAAAAVICAVLAVAVTFGSTVRPATPNPDLIGNVAKATGRRASVDADLSPGAADIGADLGQSRARALRRRADPRQ